MYDNPTIQGLTNNINQMTQYINDMHSILDDSSLIDKDLNEITELFRVIK